MNKTLTILLVLVATLIISGVMLGGSYISHYNMGNRLEKRIQASWENNENILAQYSLKIKEMAQVPDKYSEQLSDTYRDIMAGRYGDDGSTAMFQWIREQNPDFDAQMYNKLQTVMEAGRNEFRVSQTVLVDVKRQYKTKLDDFWGGLMLSWAGYPKINLDEYKVITSSHAQEAFESGVDSGIEL